MRNTAEIGAVSHLEAAVGCVIVADESQSVGPDGHGGVLTDITCVIQGGEGGVGAGSAGAVGYLESAVGHVVVADEAQTVGPHGHGGELTDIASAVQGGD